MQGLFQSGKEATPKKGTLNHTIPTWNISARGSSSACMDGVDEDFFAAVFDIIAANHMYAKKS